MLLYLALLMNSLPTQQQMTYHVHMQKPQLHYYHMEIEVKHPKGKEAEWMMPTWTPGSYLIREFSKNVDRVEAFDESGTPLPIEKTGKNTWIVKHHKRDYTLKYRVYAFEESVRNSFLDADRSFFMPTSTCLYPVGMDLPVTLNFYPPNHWKDISTPLPEGKTKWQRKASTKDELYDSPVEMGNHETYPFSAAGNAHFLVMAGGGNFEIDSLLPPLQRIIEIQTDVFGTNPANPYYFLVNNTLQRGGGLEHKNSAGIQFVRDGYSDGGWKNFLALLSHEYFHVWNVKRLRPVALGPFDYAVENYSTSLWIAEGFTSYYDDRFLLQADIYDEAAYLRILQGSIGATLNNSGDGVQSVTESSFDAWVKAYRRTENSGNTEVSYYTKGGVLAFMFDLLIIGHSNTQYSLDDVMRTAYQTFYLEQDKGYTEDEFKAVIEQYAGQSLDAFYADYVYGRKPLDLNPYLEIIGMQLAISDITEADAGMSVSPMNTVLSVLENGAAAKAGINAGDQILAINNITLTQGFDAYVDDYAVGDALSITVDRRGLTRSFNLVLEENARKSYQLIAVENPTDTQVKCYQKWLRRGH